MLVNYAYRFLSQSNSMIPSSPWQKIQIFVERESGIIEKLIRKGGSHIDIKEVAYGTFIEHYEIAKVE